MTSAFIKEVKMSNNCNIWADTPVVHQTNRIISGGGHRLCSGPQPPPAVKVTVRLRQYRRFWFNRTLAKKEEVITNGEVPIVYHCKGSGHQTVYTTFVVREGRRNRKVRSQRVSAHFCS
jgi:hypothetical protein